MCCVQYVMGKYEAAAESLRRSLATVRTHFPEAGALSLTDTLLLSRCGTHPLVQLRTCIGWMLCERISQSSCTVNSPCCWRALLGPMPFSGPCIPCACTNFATVRLLATEEHLLTVQQRLGMVLALLGEYDTAKQLLHEVAPALGEWRGFRSCR